MPSPIVVLLATSPFAITAAVVVLAVVGVAPAYAQGPTAVSLSSGQTVDLKHKSVESGFGLDVPGSCGEFIASRFSVSEDGASRSGRIVRSTAEFLAVVARLVQGAR